jgi:ribonuclease HIII
VQGKGAEEWVQFVLEPQILQQVVIGYDDVLDPSASKPHIGVDESGKGDFFGPIVIAAVYTDEPITRMLREMEVRDSKRITSDKKAAGMAADLRKALGGKFNIVTIGPAAYNRLYSSMKNVNRLLAWGHARAIENMLDKVPECPRALSDQFGPTHRIERALLKRGRKIKLEQRPKAESDPAVAAASILARAAFIAALERMEEKYDTEFPKGASAKVREKAVSLVKQQGPLILHEVAKCHFKTTDQVLAAAGFDRTALQSDNPAETE